MIKDIVLTADTPLSDLFRRTFHEELRQVINAWRPFLINDDKTKDALELCRRPSLQMLADYLFLHSNLSRTASTLYQLLALARREWEQLEK